MMTRTQTKENQPQSLLGHPHFELVHRYGYHESLVGRYATRKEAIESKYEREAVYGIGRCVIRYREF